MRSVEREEPRLHFWKGGLALRTRKQLAEEVIVVAVVQHHQPVCELQSFLHALSETTLFVGAEREAIQHQLDGVLLVTSEGDFLIKPPHLAINPRPHKALLRPADHFLAVLALAFADHRRKQQAGFALCVGIREIGDLLRSLGGHRNLTLGAVRSAQPCEEQPEVVVHLRDRAHRGAWVAVYRFLVNRNGWTEPLDVFHLGLVHLPKELAGVGRE